jgi:hypothetical protein
MPRALVPGVPVLGTLFALGLLGTASCGPARQAPPATEPSSGAAAIPLAAAPDPNPAPAPPARFEDTVMPILEVRCQPCHFPGGVMYERLPFDRPRTIRDLGTRLFTRLTDPDEQAAIQAFLDQPPGPGELGLAGP